MTELWTVQMQSIVRDALNLSPTELSAVVGEILAAAPRSVADDALAQLEAGR